MVLRKELADWFRNNWLRTLGLIGVLLGFTFQIPFEYGATSNLLVSTEVYLPVVFKPTGPTLANDSVFSIRVISDDHNAIEATNQPISLRVSRTGGLGAIILEVATTGSDNAALSSASGTDYILRKTDGTVIDSFIEFGVGQWAQDIEIVPVPDDTLEVPEELNFALVEHSDYQINPTNRSVEMKILDDAPGITQDSLLLFAQMHAEGDADTNANGLAALRLSNDNSYAMLDMEYSNLTSEQTAAHIHVGTPLSGPIVYSVGMGQINGDRWDIEAAHHLVTNQDTLDALIGGHLYINVHSADYNGGEIRGTFAPVEGGIAMQVPPDPDPIASLTGAELERDIARFLTQATFGPTPATVADMQTRVANHGGDRIAAYTEWLDEQMLLEAPSAADFSLAQMRMYAETNGTNINWGARVSGFEPAWYTGAVYSKAQLRERMAFALSEILVISQGDNALRANPWMIGSYYDMLKGHAFTDYQTLLTDVSTHPAMGNYLSHLRNSMERVDGDGNVISSPDENYAREVMQLFSIGLVQLHPDGSIKLSSEGLPTQTYDQTDITELARVFTGWGYAVTTPDNGVTDSTIENTNFNFGGYSRDNQAYYHPHFMQSMKMFEDNGLDPTQGGYQRYHDNLQKTILGQTFPAGQTGEQDLDQAMAMLATHANTAPFISYRLIQRLVTSNPSPGYIYRVSQVFTNTNGDLGEVLKAILLDPEARNLDHLNRVSQGRLSEPLVRLAGALRTINATSTLHNDFQLITLNSFGLPVEQNALYEANTSIIYISQNSMLYGDGLRQSPLYAPSVFNWFSPDYVPAGAVSEAGLVTPEMQIATENNVINTYNTYQNLALWSGIWGQRPQHNGEVAKVVFPVTSPFHDIYTAALDTNDDNLFTSVDETFDDPNAIRNASAALVDALDLYLCGGYLAANATGDTLTDPREIVITGVYDAHFWRDGGSDEAAATARDRRVREAVLLLSTAPQCIMQH